MFFITLLTDDGQREDPLRPLPRGDDALLGSSGRSLTCAAEEARRAEKLLLVGDADAWIRSVTREPIARSRSDWGTTRLRQIGQNAERSCSSKKVWGKELKMKNPGGVRQGSGESCP